MAEITDGKTVSKKGVDVIAMYGVKPPEHKTTLPLADTKRNANDIVLETDSNAKPKEFQLLAETENIFVGSVARFYDVFHESTAPGFATDFIKQFERQYPDLKGASPEQVREKAAEFIKSPTGVAFAREICMWEQAALQKAASRDGRLPLIEGVVPQVDTKKEMLVMQGRRDAEDNSLHPEDTTLGDRLNIGKKLMEWSRGKIPGLGLNEVQRENIKNQIYNKRRPLEQKDPNAYLHINDEFLEGATLNLTDHELSATQMIFLEKSGYDFTQRYEGQDGIRMRKKIADRIQTLVAARIDFANATINNGGEAIMKHLNLINRVGDFVNTDLPIHLKIEKEILSIDLRRK
jgi:hypothetical protein